MVIAPSLAGKDALRWRIAAPWDAAKKPLNFILIFARTDINLLYLLLFLTNLAALVILVSTSNEGLAQQAAIPTDNKKSECSNLHKAAISRFFYSHHPIFFFPFMGDTAYH
jgi:hypothetical protein